MKQQTRTFKGGILSTLATYFFIKIIIILPRFWLNLTEGWKRIGTGAHCNPLGAPSIIMADMAQCHLGDKKSNIHPHLQSTTDGLPRMRTHPKTCQKCPETFLFDVSSPVSPICRVCAPALGWFWIENKGVTNSRIPKILRTLTPGSWSEILGLEKNALTQRPR